MWLFVIVCVLLHVCMRRSSFMLPCVALCVKYAYVELVYVQLYMKCVCVCV